MKLWRIAFGYMFVFLYSQAQYYNPIISGFNPDPSICKAGKHFYLVTSSFSYFPGVPIYKSMDLINWTHVGYCLTTTVQLNLGKGSISEGIWAPTIRYTDGTFYMITTNQSIPSKKRNFYVYTQNPEKAWSEPVWLDIEGYDPSLFCEDGKWYVTFAKGEGNNAIFQAELDIQTGKLLGGERKIWEGTGEFGIEGPHLYRKGAYYYLMVSEGGTGLMHQVSIARSKSLWGPWEKNPSNPILTNRNKRWLRIQAAGHADLVEDNSGNWWMVHLGIRNYAGFEDQWSVLGRETHLLPVKWNADGWPVVNEVGVSEIEIRYQVPTKQDRDTKFTDTFDSDEWPLAWNFIRRPEHSLISRTVNKGKLTLTATNQSLDSSGTLAFVGIRQKDYGMSCRVTVQAEPTSERDESGLTVFMSEKYHYDLFVSIRKGKKHLIARRVIDDMVIEQSSIDISDMRGVELHIDSNPWAYMMYYTDKNANKIKIAHMQSKFISIHGAGGFTGMYLGLYATSQRNNFSSYFDDFKYFKTEDWY